MENLLMKTVVGFSFLTLLSYLLIVINSPFLIIPITLLLIYIFRNNIFKIFKNVKVELNRQTIITLFVFTLGIIGQMLVIAPSGMLNKDGDLVFWSSHGHDGPWHIALVEEMKKGYPFANPVFAGTELKNYHFFSDVLPMVFNKYLGFDNFDLYFRIFPLFYSILFGASAYFLTKRLTKNFNASIWATIFTYFAGSWGYLIGKSESVFWATQPQSSIGNPPQIISDFMFLSAIYFVIGFLQSKTMQEKKDNFISSFLILATISSFKIYAGLVLLGTLAIIATYNLIVKKEKGLFLLTLVSGIMALILYLPNSSGSKDFLIFEPWWYIRTMIVEPSRLNLIDWELRRQTYLVENNYKRVIYLETLGFLIFFFGNLGMRFIGLIEFFKSNAIFKISIIISIVFPLIFLQKGVASNTSQFLQYFVLLFGILSGIAISKIKNKWLNIALAPLIFLLMVPTQFNLIKSFYSRPAFAKISQGELKALEYIKDNTNKDSVILTPPYNEYLDLKGSTPNIWDWFDTSYVASLTGRQTYFDDYEQMDIMGYPYRERLKVKKVVFESEDTKLVQDAIKETNADIIYFPTELKPKVKLEDINITKLFENESAQVWKIN